MKLAKKEVLSIQNMLRLSSAGRVDCELRSHMIVSHVSANKWRTVYVGTIALASPLRSFAVRTKGGGGSVTDRRRLVMFLFIRCKSLAPLYAIECLTKVIRTSLQALLA